MATVTSKTRTFEVTFLLNVLYGEEPGKVYDIINSVGRWSINHEMVFQAADDGKFYRTVYAVGATEYQSETPWEYEGPRIKCVEVAPVQELVTVYRAVQVVEEDD